jgi:hypothetical protein
MKTKIIFATSTRDGKIVHATVEATDNKHLPITITSRMGDTVHIAHDGLDALILALQQIQSQVQTGFISSRP